MATTARPTPGTIIRNARAEAGLTQDKLADRLRTTRQVVIGWEKDRHAPKPHTRARIAEAFGDPDMFGDDEDEEASTLTLDELLRRRVSEIVLEVVQKGAA